MTEALRALDERQRGAAFPNDGNPHEGHLHVKFGGKIYVPCLGRIHVDFDPDTGQVTESKILSRLAIEARQERGGLVPVEGAVPVDRHELQEAIHTPSIHGRQFQL